MSWGQNVTMSEGGSAISARATQLGQLPQCREWLQSTPGLAASEHTGITEKGFFLGRNPNWQRESCTVVEANRARVAVLMCDCAIMQRFFHVCLCMCVYVCAYSRGSRVREEPRLLTAVCFPNLCVCHTRLKAGHSKEKKKWGKRSNWTKKWWC